MSKFHIKKSQLAGEIRVPPSKSHTLRSLLFASLAEGRSHIHDPLPSTDTHAMIEACRLFGASIDWQGNTIIVDGFDGSIRCTEDVINAGNSGIVLRFCSAVGALSSCPVVITGDHSIRHQRPMQPLIDGLHQLGATAVSMRGDGYAPLIIQGPLRPGTVHISGADSQPVSALLIAGAFAPGPIEICVSDPGEKPWVALTLDWLERLKIPYTNESFERYTLEGNASYAGFDYTVPGDFSSAAFPLVGALITGSELSIHNIDMNDPQGDKKLIPVLQKMGAHIVEKGNTLHVGKGSYLRGITVDINDFVDAVTILAVAGCYAEGETRIINGAVARQKECNRLRCITTELQKMGATISETEDGLIVRKSALKGAAVTTYDDHRMALSLAVAGFGAEGETTISDVECISKTFGNFRETFHSLGAQIEQLG